MTVRVTQVFLEVLTTRGTPLNGYADSTYDFNFTVYEGYADAAYDLDIPLALEGYADSQYVIPDILQLDVRRGFTSQYKLEALFTDQANFNSSYLLDAQAGLEGYHDALYTLNSQYQATQGYLNGNYALNAWVAQDSTAVSSYALSAAFAAIEAAFESIYELPIFVEGNGFTDSVYVFDAYVPFEGYSDVDYQLQTYLQLEERFGSEYALQIWEALETSRNSQYGLVAAYQAAQGYADALYQLQRLQQLDAAFSSAFSLDALLAAQTFHQSGYTLNKTLEAVLGFADAEYILNAYLPADGYSDSMYDVFVYVPLSGYADGVYDLLALLELQGWTDSTYFLDVTDAIYTWVVNQNSGAPYRYENMDFHSFAQIGNDYLGAKADGIYLLDGDDDNGTPIDAIASTGRLDFGSNRAKRVLGAYLGVDTAGQVNLTLRTDAGRSSGPYQFRVSPTGAQVERAKFAKGLKSKYWQFDIENVAGGELSLDEIQFDVLELKQRLKR